MGHIHLQLVGRTENKLAGLYKGKQFLTSGKKNRVREKVVSQV
jgi:hypothetical protein